MKKWLLPFAALFSSAAFGTNIVQNPGFELGSFSGWTAASWVVSTGVDGVPPHSGGFFAANGCVGAACLTTPKDFVYQILATSSGQTYTVSFFYDLGNTICKVCVPVPPDDPTDSFAELKVLWGGGTILDAVQSTPLPDSGWVLFTANVLATSNSMQLEFIGRQDPGALGIDDVCVDLVGGACGAGVVPEPSPLILSCAGIAVLGLLGLCRQAFARAFITRS